MKTMPIRRFVALVLVLALLTGFAIPVTATDRETAGRSNVTFTQVDNCNVSNPLLPPVAERKTQEPEYADTDMVRVSIVLDEESTISRYCARDIAQNEPAMAWRQSLRQEQADLTLAIEQALGARLDVVWNLTLAANIISANVPYGQIPAIQAVDGVRSVVPETRYDPAVVKQEETANPNMATSGRQIGSSLAWAAGYTGAGSRIAVIDTGIDTDHQSFDEAAFLYAANYQAGRNHQSLEEYLDTLLDAEEIAAVANKLNVSIDPETVYLNTKLPFGYNYIDQDYDITHDNDVQGYHGSHVAGIAAANTYIRNMDGTFAPALASVHMQGVAPDAQLITMKVFGKNGGAYESDYMAAIEDAMILDCDAVNLSLGTATAGFTGLYANPEYARIMENVRNSGMTVAIAGGNAYQWPIVSPTGGYLYADDVNWDTLGAPASYSNSLAVASVDNDGTVSNYFTVADHIIIATDATNGYDMRPLSDYAGEWEYLLLDGYGSYDDWDAVCDDLPGKIAVCSRGGDISFYDKINAAMDYGAAAVVVYNNEPGSIGMDMNSENWYSEPAVSISQADGAFMKENATAVTDDEGNVRFYLGTMTISGGKTAVSYNSEYYTMSAFSSWGVPGSLELKPEITAPGGSIYSVNGTDTSGKAYAVMSGTSMATPQVAGMAAVVAQYIKENGLVEKTGLDVRTLSQSLLLSTATPLEASAGVYYPVIQQGAGLANVGAAISADSYILMEETMNAGATDGKVKVELGDDPGREGEYTISFTLHNLTDTERAYVLSADFFTQNYFQGEDRQTWYMDTLTTAMPALLQWSADGKILNPAGDMRGCDFNGDGLIQTADGQRLLDYAVGLTDELTNADKADRDTDGDVDTHDAYLFLRDLGTSFAIAPAGGKVEITLRVELTEQWEQFYRNHGTKGLYIEGYVFAESLPNAEGVAGTSHSIPVLGWYGDWSDPSMFDVGDYHQRFNHGENRVPYVTELSRYLTIRYATEPANNYYFSGNPIVPDATYMPERNAINTRDSVVSLGFQLIRNATAHRYAVQNLTSGQVLEEFAEGALYSAIYSPNHGTWLNNGYYTFVDADISRANEGDRIRFLFSAATEYSTNADGTVDWDKLGQGSTFSVTLNVDNTFPVLENIYYDVVNHTLVVKASDNRYLAAVALYNAGGKRVLNAAGAKVDIQPGETAEYILDLNTIPYGESFLLQVVDYAKNTVTYRLEMEIGQKENLAGRMFGFALGGDAPSSWVEIDPQNVYFKANQGSGGLSAITTTDLNVVEAEYVDGHVFIAALDAGKTNLYVAKAYDLSWGEKVGTLGYRDVRGMAMNYADGKLYILSQSNGTDLCYRMTISSIDLYTMEVTDLYDVETAHPRNTAKSYTQLRGLAIDDDGRFYSVCDGNSILAYLYTWTSDMAVDGKISELSPINKTTSGRIGFATQNATLAWDHDRDILYMAAASSTGAAYVDTNRVLVTLNTATGKGTKTSTNHGGFGSSASSVLSNLMQCMYIVPSGGFTLEQFSSASAVVLNQTQLRVPAGASFLLEAMVQPWNLSNTSVIWTSSDNSIATVSGQGFVQTWSNGTVRIRATSAHTPDVYAECEISVAKLDVALSALISDADGVANWAEFTAAAPAGWDAVGQADTAYKGGVQMGDKIIVHDGSRIYSVDADTFAATPWQSQWHTDWLWSDAAPATTLSGGAFKNKFVAASADGQALTLFEVGSEWLFYWTFSSLLPDAAYRESKLATIAQYDAGYYNGYPANFYYLLSTEGVLYRLVLYRHNSGEYKPEFFLIGETGLYLKNAHDFDSGDSASMVYDKETGYLLVSTYIQGNHTARLHAIEPELLISTELGTFGGGTWPVVALHQHRCATVLTLRMRTKDTALWEKETLQLDVDAVMGATNALTYATSDANVVTVSNTGLVTAVGEGTATVTVTTTDTDRNGNTISESVEITVKPLLSKNITVNAQIVTGTGTQWATISTENMEITTIHQGGTRLEGGGYIGHNTVAGTNNGYYYMSDMTNDFAESSIGIWWPAFEDATYAPGIRTSDGVAFDLPLFLDGDGVSFYGKDPYTGSLSGYGFGTEWRRETSAYECMALAYVSSNDLTQSFMMVSRVGKLYRVDITAQYRSSSGEYYFASQDVKLTEIADLGKVFDTFDHQSMAYDGTGLILADASNNVADLYYIDLTTDTLALQKIGRIPGVTYITGLYTPQEVSGEFYPQTAVETPEDTATGGTEESENRVTMEEAERLQSGYGRVMGPDAAPDFGIANEFAPKSDEEIEEGEKTVTVTVTTKEAANNGLVTVSYDAAKLALKSAVISGDYTAKAEEDGKLTFGYVALNEIPAEGTIATLTFNVLNTDDSDITVEHKQLGNAVGTTETIKVEFEHKNTEIRDAIEATCTTAGYTGDTWCLDCNRMVKKGEIIQALGHSFGEWKVTKPATCTEKGVETRTCTACGETETREIDATGHNFGAWTVVKEATCTEDGLETRVCACGEAENREIRATGHSFGEWTLTKAPTCTENGVETRTCVCGETEERIVAALGH
ncbi:MAG: hypothetical protein E7459_07985, partial [Ruminococcaceae bacterium]|nr:hypothetical protein [Oscillospiraceae bacterium]